MKTKPKFTPATSIVIARRKAAAVLNTFCLNTLGMGTMAERFHGDNDDEWAALNETHMRAMKENTLVAVVEFDGEYAILTIPDARMLANRRHRSEFVPAEFGFGPQPMNWREEVEPYVIKEPMPSDIPGLNAPVRTRQRSLQDMVPEVIGSL